MPQDVYWGLDAQADVWTHRVIPSVYTWPGWEWCRKDLHVQTSVWAPKPQ